MLWYVMCAFFPPLAGPGWLPLWTVSGKIPKRFPKGSCFLISSSPHLEWEHSLAWSDTFQVFAALAARGACGCLVPQFLFLESDHFGVFLPQTATVPLLFIFIPFLSSHYYLALFCLTAIPTPWISLLDPANGVFSSTCNFLFFSILISISL